MEKRKKHQKDDTESSEANSPEPALDSDPVGPGGDSEVEDEIVNVDFDYFDPKEVDFHAIKNLLRQLLDSDNTEFNLSAFADLILASPGTAIKVDGPESDPFALFSVVDLTGNRKTEVGKQIRSYAVSRTSRNPQFNRQLRQLFASKASIGLIISERLINMPVEVIPPLYRLYLRERDVVASTSSKGKVSDKDEEAPESDPPAEEAPKSEASVPKRPKAAYEYYLIISKGFTEVDSELEERPKKRRALGFDRPQETFCFHPEDQVLGSFADHSHSYSFKNESQDSDSKRAFQDVGIIPKGQLMLIPAAKFEAAVSALEQKYPSDANQSGTDSGK